MPPLFSSVTVPSTTAVSYTHLAGDVAADGGFDQLLGKEEAARELYGDVEIAVVHALELDADGEALDAALGAAVSCHALYHTLSAPPPMISTIS